MTTKVTKNGSMKRPLQKKMGPEMSSEGRVESKGGGGGVVVARRRKHCNFQTGFD